MTKKEIAEKIQARTTPEKGLLVAVYDEEHVIFQIGGGSGEYSLVEASFILQIIENAFDTGFRRGRAAERM